MSETTSRSYNVRAVERVCRILNIVQEQPKGVSLGEVADASELPKTSAFRYLWTLEQFGYVRRDTGGSYRVGPGIVSMTPHRMDALVASARGWLAQLRDETKETLSLGVMDGQQVVYHAVAESPRAVRLTEQVGARELVHSTALGKVLAAQMPDDAIRRLLHSQGMPALTENTFTSPEDFMIEMQRVRRQGYAVNNQENENDGRCVGVAIDGIQLPAAISLSAPANRLPMTAVPTMAKLLRTAAERIAADLAP